MADDKLTLPNTVISEPWNSYYSDVFTPWEVKEQLEIGKEVKGSTWWMLVKCWQTYISTTGTLAITWVGFKPKYIEFEAVDWFASFSQMKTDWVTQNGYRMWRLWTWDQYSDTNYAAELYRVTPDDYFIIDFSSFDTDWFTINRLVVDFGATLKWTCFW